MITMRHRCVSPWQAADTIQAPLHCNIPFREEWCFACSWNTGTGGFPSVFVNNTMSWEVMEIDGERVSWYGAIVVIGQTLGNTTCSMKGMICVQAISFEVSKRLVPEPFDHIFVLQPQGLAIIQQEACSHIPASTDCRRLSLRSHPWGRLLRWCMRDMHETVVDVTQVTLRPSKKWVKKIETIKDNKLKRKGTRRSSPQASGEDVSYRDCSTNRSLLISSPFRCITFLIQYVRRKTKRTIITLVATHVDTIL